MNRYIDISLDKSDGFLADDKMPIYLIKTKSNVTRIKKYNKRRNRPSFGLHENMEEGASFVISEEANSEDIKITGTVGSHSLAITPITSRRHKKSTTRRSRRSLGDIPKSKENNYHLHLVHQIHKNKSDTHRHLSNPSSEPHPRYKRSKPIQAIPQTIYPEILIVVDNELRKKLGDISSKAIPYLLAFWNSVDMRFRGLTLPNYRLNIAGIVFAMDDQALSYINNNKWKKANFLKSILAYQDSKKFWYQQNDSIPVSSYDIIFTMTANFFCIYSANNDTCSGQITGLAPVGGACKVDSVGNTMAKIGLVSDMGSFDFVETAAHELGHLLGAYHDDTKTSNCFNSSNHIMATAWTTKLRSSYWSKCSIREFKNFLVKDNPTCLYNKPERKGRILLDKLPGELINADNQCKNIWKLYAFGNWRACNNNDDNFCASIKCSSPHFFFPCQDTQVPALDGTTCGIGKYCMFSKCVDKPNNFLSNIPHK